MSDWEIIDVIERGAYEEALDLVVYLRQAIEKRDDRRPERLRTLARSVAAVGDAVADPIGLARMLRDLDEAALAEQRYLDGEEDPR